jgi:hypothetical protein
MTLTCDNSRLPPVSGVKKKSGSGKLIGSDRMVSQSSALAGIISTKRWGAKRRKLVQKPTCKNAMTSNN